MINDTLVRCLRCMVFFNVFCPVPVFLFELQAGAKVILQWTLKRAVNLIHQGDKLGIVYSIITKQLPGMSPVFLFDMGIIVFLVRSRASKSGLGWVIGKIAD